MKIPEKIKGRNRIRDGAIVLYFKREGLNYDELAEKFKLTQRRILQILARNHAFVKRDKDWEREKRINRLSERLKKSKPTEKDELDILAELRKEIEGDIKIQQSTQVNVYPNKTIVFRDLPDDNDQTGNRILHEPEGSGSSRSEGTI